MRVRRIISIILLTALSAGSAGCTATRKSSVDTVEVWSQDSHSKLVYDQIIKDFNEGEGKESGIEIKYKVIEGDAYQQSLDVALQNGQAPDLFSSSWELRKDVENDYLMPIDELPGIDKYIDKYSVKNMLTDGIYKLDDKVYRLPQNATTQGLVYNKDMFKQAGIVDENGEAKPPETLDELREDAKKLTNTEKMEYGIILPMKWGMWYGSDISSLGMSSFGHEGWNPVNGQYEYEKYVPILNTYLGMKEDGSVFPGADGLDNDQARARFAAGKIGMKMAYSFDVGVYNDQFPAEIDWGVAPYPVIDANNKYKQRMSAGYCFSVNAKATEHISAEKLAKVYEFFICDETIQKLFESCVEIPVDTDNIDFDSMKEGKKGWVEFCKMVDISANVPSTPKTDWTALDDLGSLFTKKVYSGEMSAEEAAAQANINAKQAEEKYYSKNPEENPDKYLQPNWNIKR